MNTTVNDGIEFWLKKFTDDRGYLTPVTGGEDLIFPIKRVFYAWDVPHKETRGYHAHHVCEQILICLKGSIDVKLKDGADEKVITLNKPNMALFIPTGIWAEETYYDDAILLALCSHKYAKADYITDWEEFLEWKKS